VWSSPAVDAASRTVWVTTGNGGTYGQSMVALNATTLALKGYWTDPDINNDADFGAGVTVVARPGQPTLAVSTNKDGWVSALSSQNLSSSGQSGPVWRDRTTTLPGPSTCHLNGIAIAPAAFDGRSIYLGGSITTVLGSPADGSVRAADPGNGSFVWQTPTRGSVYGGVVAGGGLVVDVSTRLNVTGFDGSGCPIYLGSNNAWLQVLSASNGSVLYEHYFPHRLAVAPAISDGRIYVTSGPADATSWTTQPNHEGHVFAFGVPLESRPTLVGSGWTNDTAVSIRLSGSASGGSPYYNCSVRSPGALSVVVGSPATNGSTCDGAAPTNVTYLIANGTFVGYANATDALGGSASRAFAVQLSERTTCSPTRCTRTEWYAVGLPGGPPMGCQPTNCRNVTTPVRPTYAVVFHQEGLAMGSLWTVDLNGTSVSTSLSSETFLEGNGSYDFAVGPVGGEFPNPGTGTVRVLGQAVSILIRFASAPVYPIDFLESGLPNGTDWWVIFDGVEHDSFSPDLTISAANGTHRYSAATQPGWSTSNASGEVQVLGRPVRVDLAWVGGPEGYPVTFLPTGLPSGSTWSVTFRSTTESGDGALVFSDTPNGSFGFSIGPVAGALASPVEGTVSVHGGAVHVSISFHSHPKEPLALGGASEVELVAGAIGAAVVVALGTVGLLRRRRRSTPPIRPATP
ncbi:MAG TPA: hypothetical protein VGV64_00995, partial [Thermoplasmata archaeon]|nr:hypothetical protein [Thermoplasmata archaeon]